MVGEQVRARFASKGRDLRVGADSVSPGPGVSILFDCEPGVMAGALVLNAIASGVSFWVTIRLVRGFKSTFITAGISGKDLCKKDKPVMYDDRFPVCSLPAMHDFLLVINLGFFPFFHRPESCGVLSATVFLILMSVLLPVTFGRHMISGNVSSFPYHEVRVPDAFFLDKDQSSPMNLKISETKI